MARRVGQPSRGSRVVQSVSNLTQLFFAEHLLAHFLPLCLGLLLLAGTLGRLEFPLLIQFFLRCDPDCGDKQISS